ncbi:hypothetical protein [Bradyrhizobium canariense]|uniref:hypothetical protein n=1 Tax=Bradyrhizobium canariense TaxID=255045 RepID=UPI001430C96E|nr:hypothetical protein [Bradyrhizobium canariense]
MSVRLAVISFSFERCFGFSIFALVTGSKGNPIAGSLDRILQIRVGVTNFKSGKGTLISEITVLVQTGLTELTVLPTSVGSVDQRLALGDEFRRKDEGANCKVLAVPCDHCLGDFGDLNEEGVFRLVFLAHFQVLRRRMA